MNPVDQTILHEPGQKPRGDCFRACLASLLHLPTHKVPHFVDIEASEGDWWQETQHWLGTRGLTAIQFKVVDLRSDLMPASQAGVHCILSGQSPRGECSHAVVGRYDWDGFTVVHDPHPSRAGIVQPRWALFLVPIHPNLVYPNVG